MKLIFVLLFIFLGCSRPKTISIKKWGSKSVPDSIKQMGYQNALSPGTLLLILEIIEVYVESKFICGSKKYNTCLVKVLKVKNSGMGIINRPNINNQILVNFLSLEPKLKAGSVIEAKTIENLCIRTNSKTSYTIIN